MRICRVSPFFALLLIAVTVGCTDSKMLDNTTAEDQIRVSFRDNKYRILMHVGRVGLDCGTKPLEGMPGEVVSVGSKPDGPEIAAKAVGYITVEPDGTNFRKITLTEQGKAAADGEPYGEEVQKGCDYKQVDFPVANKELVKISGITADENNPEVEYLWHWNVTKLGEGLRENGAAYNALTPEQRNQMHRLDIMGASLGDVPVPLPPEGSVSTSVVKFKRFTDGWRMQ